MGCLEAEAWEIGVLDEWREVLSLLEQFDIWSQPEEDIDLTIIDYQWTFVELRISWTYQKAFSLLSYARRMTSMALTVRRLKGSLIWLIIIFSVAILFHLLFRIALFRVMELLLERGLEN